VHITSFAIAVFETPLIEVQSTVDFGYLHRLFVRENDAIIRRMQMCGMLILKELTTGVDSYVCTGTR